VIALAVSLPLLLLNVQLTHLAQHVNDSENVMVTFVKTWVWMHLDEPATGHRIPELWCVFSKNFFSLERATFSRVAAFRHWRRFHRISCFVHNYRLADA